MKRYLFGFIGIFMTAIFVYDQHQQPPTVRDVQSSANQWSPPITEVFTIKKIEGEWITFFRSEQMLFVGSLKKNWLGQWKIEHEITGDEQPIGSTLLDLDRNTGVILGVSGVSNINIGDVSYYYGMIENPIINTVIIEAAGETFDAIPLIKTNGKRFFLLKKIGKNVPYTFKLLNKNGEIVYKGQ